MLDFERYEVLTFDCYGTLIDWEGGITDALMPVATARGVSVSADELLRLYAEFEAAGKSGEYRAYRDVLRSTAAAICERLGFAPTDAEANCLVDSIGAWQPFGDTVDALRRLKTRYRLCVVSNVDDDLFAGTQRTLGIEFDGVVTAQQADSYKPSPNNFNLALERMGVARDKTLHIAESVKLDIAPAKALGIDAVWVNRNRGSGKQGSASGNPTDGASGADLEVPDLRTLTELMGL